MSENKIEIKGLKIYSPAGYDLVTTVTKEGVLEVSFKGVANGFVVTDIGDLFKNTEGIKAMHLDSPNSFAYMTIIGFKWKGKEYEAPKWVDLYCDLLSELLFTYPKEFEDMVSKNVCKRRGSDVGYIFKKSSYMTKDCVHIGRGYYVNKSLGGGDHIKRLFLTIFEAMSLDITDLYIYTIDKNVK